MSWSPEKRFVMMQKAETSPAYADLVYSDQLNWQSENPFISAFCGPPVKKPDGYDEQARADDERRKTELKNTIIRDTIRDMGGSLGPNWVDHLKTQLVDQSTEGNDE